MASRKTKPLKERATADDDAQRVIETEEVEEAPSTAHESIPPRSSLPAIDPSPVEEAADLKTDETETANDAEAATDAPDVRPSATMTREMPAVAVESLIQSSAESNRKMPLPPPPPTIRAMDDLAITAEAPAAQPRILLLDLTEALLEEKPFADLTEDEIASRAGLSLDVFHAHFANKAKLLAALTERFCEQAIGVTNDSTHSGIWDRAHARDVVEVSVRSILDVVLGRAALVRAVLSSGDPALLDGFRRVGANVTARVTRVLESTQSAPGDLPDARDVAFAFLLAVSLAHHTIMVGTQWSGLEFDREEIYERATRAATAYLDESMRRAKHSRPS